MDRPPFQSVSPLSPTELGPPVTKIDPDRPAQLGCHQVRTRLPRAPLPEGWSYVDAAGLSVAGSTAYGGMVDASHVRGKVVLAAHTD